MANISVRLEVNNAEQVLKDKKEAVKVALEMIGIQAQNWATLMCPVDTGRLRASLTHKRKGDNAVVIGTNVEYAVYVEFGTSKMDAQPYLKPAVEEHLDDYKAILQECLQNA